MAAIPRKTLAQFGGALSATNNVAKFGSLKAGAAAYSLDPELIQSITGGGNGWDQGWGGAVVTVGGTPNVPALQDLNAVQFVFGYMLAYLLERGIPEWDDGTTYFQYDFCRKNGVVYESRIDTNLNHDPASSPTQWASISLAVSASNSGENMAADGAAHKVAFDTEAFDTDSAFSTVTNKFTAPVAGIYSVSAYLQVDNDDANPATLEIALRIVKNGATVVLGNGQSVPNPAGDRWYPSVSGLVQLAAADTVEVQFVGTDTVGTGHVDLSNGNFSIQRTRAV